MSKDEGTEEIKEVRRDSFGTLAKGLEDELPIT